MSLGSGLRSSQDASDIVVQVDKINESKARAVEAVKEGLSHAPDHPGLLGLSAQLQGRLRASSDAKMVQDPRGKLDSPAKRLALLQKSAGDAADAFSLGFCQVILPTAPGVSNEGPRSRVLALVPFLGPGFRLGARWNRLVETVKTRKKRGKTGGKWARYGLKRVKEGS